MRVIQRAFALLERSNLRFVGNVEPQDLFTDRTDAAVCDGFVGNLLLKMYEGLLETLLRFLETNSDDPEETTREGLRLLLQRFRASYDYQNVGGAPLLGVRGTVVVAHGRSRAQAIASAILLASQLTQCRVYERISTELEKDGILDDLKHGNTALMLEQLRNRWGFMQKQNPEGRSRKADDRIEE